MTVYISFLFAVRLIMNSRELAKSQLKMFRGNSLFEVSVHKGPKCSKNTF